MRTTRIYIDQPLNPGLEVPLQQQAAGHVVRVLRLRRGDPLVLFNGEGLDYSCELVEAGVGKASVRVLAAQAAAAESPLRITLAQALARGEKMDWIVQKATELGTTRIVPLITERSEVKLDTARTDKRVAHWRGIAIGACEQSGRARVPSIAAPQSLTSWLASLPPGNTVKLALLPQGGIALRALDHIENDVLLAVGPEGGFGDKDVSALCGADFHGLTLGPRILRTETAGLAAIAALQALYGDG